MILHNDTACKVLWPSFCICFCQSHWLHVAAKHWLSWYKWWVHTFLVLLPLLTFCCWFLGEPKWILLIVVPKHVHHHINQIFPCETLLFMQPLTLTIYNSSNFFSILTVELLITYTWYGMINIYLSNLDSYVMYNIKSHTPLHFCLIFCQEVETDYLGQLQTIWEHLTARTHAYICIGLCIPEQYLGRLQLDLVTYPVCICILPCILNSPPNMGTHNCVISIQSLHHCQHLHWLLLHCFQQHPCIAILYTTLKYYNMTFSLSQSLGQSDLVLLCWHISLCDH